MAGERSIVNIMADANLGASTVKDEWKKAVAKGLIPKSEHLSSSGLRSIKGKRSGRSSPTNKR